MKQREGYKFVILEPAKTWLKEDKCAGCGKEKKDWKRSTKYKCCSKDCTTKYMRDSTYYGWPELRLKAIQRDNYKCIKCGKQETLIVNTKIGWMTWEQLKDHYITFRNTYYVERVDEEKQEIILHDISKYVVDHIHAISLGGEEWDINNLQTLCKECNKIKTKKDMGKIAQLRTKEELVRAGQKFLERLELENSEKFK